MSAPHSSQGRLAITHVPTVRPSRASLPPSARPA
jgi:hypothetical protein